MTLAAILFPPTLDPKQALRLRRFALASISYTLTMVLVTTAWLFGVLPTASALVIAAAYLAINVGFFAAIRSGLNLRFKDPSLTLYQMLAGITVVMYIAYNMDDSRTIALFGCFIVLLFGTFRLDARGFTVVTLYTLAAYALVLNLLMHLRPQAISDVRIEWMNWLMLAGFLPCFSFVGEQINTLRRRFRESEARFRSLTEMSSDFYWETDAEHRISARTESKRETTEAVFMQAASIGKRRWEISYLSPDEAVWQRHRATLDAHLPFRDFEIARRRSNGTVHFISISGDPVFDASGQFKGYRGVGTDITERKQAEATLRESEHVYRTMFDSAPEGVWMIGPDRLTTEVNQRMCDLIGCRREDMLGRNPVEFADAENARVFQANAHRVPSRETRTFELALRHRDGRNVPTEFNATDLFNNDGSVMAVLAFVVDLTDRKRHEDELLRLNTDLERRVVERTHALEVANRELESFSYSVSHDLRAPLRAIEGFSRLLENEYVEKFDERGKDYFKRIRGGSIRMGILIDDLLDLSRISRQKMQREPVDLSMLARQAADELQSTEPGRRVEWVIAPKITAQGDPGLLRIVVQNLIGNAWKYSSKRDSARIEFGACERDGRPAYFVRDNGDGFDMAYADKLFGAFQRLHSPGEFPGTGIGLATVKRVIHRHNGEVGAESRVGEGATFYFSL